MASPVFTASPIIRQGERNQQAELRSHLTVVLQSLDRTEPPSLAPITAAAATSEIPATVPRVAATLALLSSTAGTLAAHPPAEPAPEFLPPTVPAFGTRMMTRSSSKSALSASCPPPASEAKSHLSEVPETTTGGPLTGESPAPTTTPSQRMLTTLAESMLLLGSHPEFHRAEVATDPTTDAAVATPSTSALQALNTACTAGGPRADGSHW